ncbi:6-phosphofructokinase [[Emmonsia] crescens]|uniref:6-phosphofructokinase n=1 Tax=[Emmonsia] crescens TaxID=73230 RepID=A0A0G2I328_9EURO|nr:6-phosphofructokinase [Emmonsia crescens UAMH 3008]
MIKEEARGRFESRAAVPGHFQQGGKPSPMDRVRALRMALKCIQHMESFFGRSGESIAADPMSSVVIGIKGSEVVFGPMAGADGRGGLEETDTDWVHRRPKSDFWMGLKELVDTLSGRPGEDHDGVLRMAEDEGWGAYAPMDPCHFTE